MAAFSYRVSPNSFSIGDICHAQQREARVKTEPEHDVPHQPVLLQHWRARDENERDLNELHEEQVESIPSFELLKFDPISINKLLT